MPKSKGDSPSSGEKLSRRSFLVMAGGLTIGSFALPALGSGGGATNTRRLIGPPTRWGEKNENLLWTELDESGEAKVMMWTPDSKKEARDIEAFYKAASKVDWDKVIIADVPQPGDAAPTAQPKGPQPRRFEFRDESSAKFWEILRDGDSYTVTFGRIGTKGQSRTKRFDTSKSSDSAERAYGAERLAHKAVFKLIAEKLAEGYVEVGGIPPVAGTDWSRPESWQKVRDSIEVPPPRWGKPAPRPTEAQMDAFEAATGFKLPPSYRAYLQVFGPGDVNFMFYVAAPGGPKHYNLEAMYDEAREDVANEEEYLDVDFASDEYLGREPITRMVVFCRWDSDRWGWDPDEPRGGGEYAIRNWPRNGSAEIEAESFPEFLIDKLLHGGLGSWAGGDRPGFAPATARKEKSPKQRPAKPEAAKPKAGAKPKRRSAQEENKHLHKIVADPTDKAAQRAYARWLDKYGDPVGELIRVRLELATLAASDPQRAALARREKTLTARVVKKNNQELLAHGLVPWALHRLGARVRQNDEGEIRYIELEGDQINAGVLREFAAYPVLRDLELNSHPLTAEELDLIGRLAPLRELHLHDVGLGDKGFEPISRLADLEYLCLADPKTKGPGLARLAGLTKLELLHLQGLTSSRIKGHLAALESWPALRKLFLGGNKLRGEALAGLARLPRVEMLGLDENPIRDDDLAHLAELTNLKWLDLTETKITGAGLKHLQKLRRLEVLKTKELPDAEAAAPWLARLTSLRELDLEGPWVKGGSLTDAGAAHLAGLNHLTRLNLKRQRLTDAALAHFAGLQDLEELNLEHNEEIVGPGLEHLKRLPKLKRLILDSTGISNDSVPLLKTFTRLESLDVFGTKIDERGKNTLRKALPKTSI